uniref:Cwf15/Cwc15 cell cycle control protein n=1 Tax=Chlamydomonas euryale TaxID=1486919 RepID=A0A7R9YSH8_9CHLO|mmetsp:Transcript_20452/g.60867  ORF Transcript_20452/g.60867 Transcript_20452/m.60867 type:complete len:235 (+) Transcript_20452:124-828(+)
MTTAHRPTWAPAKGSEEQGGSRWFVPSVQRSVHNMPGHTNLKFRQEGQGTAEEVGNQDLRAKLEEKERKHIAKTKGVNFEEERKKDMKLLEQIGADPGGGGKAPKALIPKAADADDEDEDESESSSSSGDDDDDDEEELMRELERIKRERAEEAAKKAAEEAAKEAKEKEAELKAGNPLLAMAAQEANFAIKRRWDDDVVFKNQARSEPKQAKRFVNDTIRNDFHQRFLKKYIR